MSTGHFLLLVIMAGILGVVTQSMFGFRIGGFFVSVILGFLGGWLGSWMADAARLPFKDVVIEVGGDRFPLVWSILGTLVVMFFVSWLQNTSLFRRADGKK